MIKDKNNESFKEDVYYSIKIANHTSYKPLKPSHKITLCRSDKFDVFLFDISRCCFKQKFDFLP